MTMQLTSASFGTVKVQYTSLYDSYAINTAPLTSTFHTVVPRENSSVPLNVELGMILFSIGTDLLLFIFLKSKK